VRGFLPSKTKQLFKTYADQIDKLRKSLINLYACLARKGLISSAEVEALRRKEEKHMAEEEDKEIKRQEAKRIKEEEEKLAEEKQLNAPLGEYLQTGQLNKAKILSKRRVPGYSNEKYVELFRLYRSDNLSSLAILIKAITVGYLLAASQKEEKNAELQTCIDAFLKSLSENPLKKAYEIMYFLGEHRAAEKIVQINRNLKQMTDVFKFTPNDNFFILNRQKPGSEPNEELQKWWWKHGMELKDSEGAALQMSPKKQPFWRRSKANLDIEVDDRLDRLKSAVARFKESDYSTEKRSSRSRSKSSSAL
jgi:hypothetical protein